MKVVIVGNPFPNPQQVFIHNKIIGLARIGIEVYNVSSSNSVRYLLKEVNKSLKAAPIRTYSYTSNVSFLCNVLLRGFPVFRSAMALFAKCIRAYPYREAISIFKRNLALLILAEKVDVVHFEWNNQATDFVEVIPYLNKPYVVSIRGRGITSQPQSDSLLREKLEIVFRSATIIHSISNDLVRYLEPYPCNPTRIRVINPAIDISKVRAKKTTDWQSVRIITVAHYRWKKNILNAILVISRLINEGFDVRYEIVGEGPDREQLNFVIEETKMCDYITLMGQKPHAYVLERLSESDIFLMPSIQEGFCNAVIEAQATGLPCVVTNADGLAENVVNGLTGYVVHKFDSDQMYRALRELIIDKELRRKFGEAGSARAMDLFNQEKQIRNIERLYSEAIDLYCNGCKENINSGA